MAIVFSTVQYFNWRKHFNIQLFILLLLLSISIFFLSVTLEQGIFQTVVLFVVVASSGLWLITRLQRQLGDFRLQWLGYMWLAKLLLTLFLLYVAWIPWLDPTLDPACGYDPQRFYLQAQQLVSNKWSTAFGSLNNVGILYYYGAVFFIFGNNPVAPALVNVFVTLIAGLYLVKVGYEIKGQRSSRDWTLAFVLLLPEMLWYDVMTSRETLCAALLLFAMLTAGRYFARIKSISLSKVIIIVGLSMFAIAAVRTSMLLPVCISIVLMILLIKPQHNLLITQRVGIAIFITAFFITGLAITKYLSGYNFEVVKSLQSAVSVSKNIALAPCFKWSENSIGKLLFPKDLFQAIIFLPPRMVLYLLAPLPKILVPVRDLLAGSWIAWQRLLTLLSSVINVIIIPYALASLIQSIKTRKTNSAPLIFHISYWVTFISIAGGNLIIHERYRVMATFLLFGCAWLGARTCPKSLIIRTSLIWYGLLTLGALFYVVYKLGFV
jgi:hypothetical protein